MAENDELDMLLQNDKLRKEHLEPLAEVLGEQLHYNKNEWRTFFNNLFRHGAYGHGLVNIFRTIYDPDYITIVVESAKKLKITLDESDELVSIENKIMIRIVEKVREEIIKKKGQEAWEEIEMEIEAKTRTLIESGKLPARVVSDLKGLGGASLIATIMAGRISGFALYMVVNRIFFAITRFLGVSVGVAVAGPIIGRALSLFMGPAGWILGGLWILMDIGLSTKWKKVIPALAIIISLRRAVEYGELESTETGTSPSREEDRNFGMGGNYGMHE